MPDPEQCFYLARYSIMIFEENKDISKELYDRDTQHLSRELASSISNHIALWAPFLPKYFLCKSTVSNGGVYFMKNNLTGLIKIGFAKNFDKRFINIKASARHLGMEFDIEIIHKIPTVEYLMSSLESYLHKEFQDKRKIGEWFELTDVDIADIKSMSLEYVLLMIELNKEVIIKKFARNWESVGAIEETLFNRSVGFDTIAAKAKEALASTKILSEWHNRYIAANQNNLQVGNNIEVLVA